jgi:hypothetical protein
MKYILMKYNIYYIVIDIVYFYRKISHLIILKTNLNQSILSVYILLFSQCCINFIVCLYSV